MRTRAHTRREVAKAEAARKQLEDSVPALGSSPPPPLPASLSHPPLRPESPPSLLCVSLPRSYRFPHIPPLSLFLPWCLTAGDGREYRQLPDGSKYKGPIQVVQEAAGNRPMPHGKGVKERPSGEVYRGDFENGKYHGYGVLELPEQGVYTYFLPQV